MTPEALIAAHHSDAAYDGSGCQYAAAAEGEKP